MTAPATTLAAALTYAHLGWQVIPLNWPTPAGCSCQRGDTCGSPGKHPWRRWRDSGGMTDPGLIRWCWRKQPDSGVGILTGRDRSGLWVLDIDPGHGGEDTIARLEGVHGRLPVTLTAVTGSGGRHLLFAYPESGAAQTAGRVGPGVDSRSDGGLIVAAPSLHRSGRRYTWANWGHPIAEPPAWLLELVQPKQPDRPVIPLPARGTERGTRYAEAALKASCARVRSTPVGQRNTTLNQAAYSMGRLVGAGLISPERTGRELLAAALAIGLAQGEAEDTILSGLRSGAKQPRGVPA